MDPRHPEEALERIDQLINQFRHILDKLRTEAVSSRLAEAEREGALVVQEICLVAPRLHETMMQTSRQQRHDLSHGVVVEANDQIIAINEATTEEAEIMEKPKKKTTRKKKTTKKADK